MKFALGIKENMTEYFTEDGTVIPVTVLSVPPMVITQIKTEKKDGYNAVQVGFGKKNKKNLSKALLGHFKDLGNFRYAKEFKVDDLSKYKTGDSIVSTEIFTLEEKIQVSAISKGKGFQGVVKRHRFHGGPRSHGQKHSEREPGSIGSGGMQRVQKGMRMGGRMGSDRITQKNQKIIFIDSTDNLLLVKGSIPGRKGTLVEIIGK